ncbi:MAG: dihydroorotate dehydrogenase electron transfer subunit [Phycisphaerae bacterium]
MSSSDPTTSRRGVFDAEVLINEKLCDEHWLMILRCDSFPPTQPGQFVQLTCRPQAQPVAAREVDWPEDRPPRLTQAELKGTEPLLRRPFSLAGRRNIDQGVELDIIYRVVGRGTRFLAGILPGEAASLLGPLGNRFEIRPDKPAAALVGGGVGIPPMIYLAEALGQAGRDTNVFVGAQRASLLPLQLAPGATPADDGTPRPCLSAFVGHTAGQVVATDDGSLGTRGLVTEPLTAWLDELPFGPQQLVVYCCGPEPMMRAVGEICIRRGIECQLSMERSMGCGMGTCQSCICKTKAPTQSGWAYKLCCTDGPVFQADQLIWQ